MEKKIVKPKWFWKGDEGVYLVNQESKIEELRREKNVPRFWLRKGEEAIIVFLDDEGFYVRTHQFKLNNSWKNFVTCVKDFQPCPLCNSGSNSTLIVYYTIIDTREFVTEDGRKIKNVKKLFPAKRNVRNILLELKKKHNGLTGRAVRVKRHDQPNCGDYFEVLKKVDVTKLATDVKPFNYEKVLAPPTEEELKYYGFGAGAIIGNETETIDEDELSDILE